MIRTAEGAEMDDVFMMGYDAWSEGKSGAEYLATCRASEKYADGEWRVLVEDGVLLASLVVYRLSETARGLGSIAAPPALRGRGHASRLIAGVIADLDRGGSSPAIFLFSDIAPDFYSRFNFAPLPDAYQKKDGSVCMLRGPDEIWNGAGFVPPPYF